MNVAFVAYAPLETVSGGYLYDRMLIERLIREGDLVRPVLQKRRDYAWNLVGNLSFRNPGDVDLILQDELNHPSLVLANRRHRDRPIVCIVHHLRASEHRSAWANQGYRLVERSYLQTIDGFIFNSETTRRSVEELVGARAPCVVATPGGDRLGAATERDVRERLATQRPLRLVALGSVIPGKGLDIILRALLELRGEKVQLEVVGPMGAAPRFVERMQRMATSLDLPVAFRGVLDDDQLGAQLKSCDVLVLPSFYEGFGIAFLEGMAHGLPAIGATTGATPTLIRDGINGFLVPPGEIKALADRIRQLSRDRALLQRLSLEALRTFSSFPTWEQTTGAIRAFLLKIPRSA